MKDKIGQIINKGSKLMRRWKEYSEELLETNKQDTVQCNVNENRRLQETKQETVDEIVQATRKLKIGKTAGNDCIKPKS